MTSTDSRQGTTSAESVEHRHQFTREVLEREIEELENTLARKRAELAACLAPFQNRQETRRR